MRVALVNAFHAGDVIMSRAIIKRVRPLLVDRVQLHLECHARYHYLWEDLGLPVLDWEEGPDTERINLWFGCGEDLLGVSGMTHATQVTSYNRQAQALGLPTLVEESEVSPSLDLPAVDIPYTESGVLVENGPVLSGQLIHELNPLLPLLSDTFHGTTFYCTGRLPDKEYSSRIVDVSRLNLIQISALSHLCSVMISRLSGPFISTLTERNRGRLKRLVWGSPIGCPIWDESDVEYFNESEEMVARLGVLLR